MSACPVPKQILTFQFLQKVNLNELYNVKLIYAFLIYTIIKMS